MSVDGVVMMMLCLSAVSMQVGPLGQRRRQELIAGQEQHGELRAVARTAPSSSSGRVRARAFPPAARGAPARTCACRRPALRRRPGRHRAASWRRRRCCARSGMRTSRSGRSAPRSPMSTWACSVKSQCSDMPASSTTRRSVSSPQRPRTSGRRSAVDEIAGLALQEACTFTRLSIWPVSLPVDSALFAFDCESTALPGCASASIDGLDQLLDGFFALLERGAGHGLVASEHFAREFEEGFAVGIERRARSALDGRAHLRLALRQQFGSACAQFGLGGELARAWLRVRRCRLRRAARRAACRADSRSAPRPVRRWTQ